MTQKNAMAVDVRRLPPTVTVPEAGSLLGISRGSAYEAARTGQIPALRIGARLVVPTAQLLRLLEGVPTEPKPGA